MGINLIDDRFCWTISAGTEFIVDGKSWKLIATKVTSGGIGDTLDTLKVDGVIYKDLKRYKIKERLDKANEIKMIV